MFVVASWLTAFSVKSNDLIYNMDKVCGHLLAISFMMKTGIGDYYGFIRDSISTDVRSTGWL